MSTSSLSALGRLLVVWCGLSSASAFAQLLFAPLPMETPESLGRWKPTLEFVGATLGATVRISYSDSYAAILEKFERGELDLAFLGPLPYVTLKERFPAAEPVVLFREANGQATYTCAVVGLSERALVLKALRGKTVALTQPLSTCGYLSTDGLLQAEGSTLAWNRYRYLDKHDSVAIAVARGDYDLGGLKTSIGRKYAHLGVVVLAESPPLPGFALVANSARLSPQRIAALRAALIAADARQRAAWADAVRHGASPARDEDYDAVRKLRRHEGPIPEEGNF